MTLLIRCLAGSLAAMAMLAAGSALAQDAEPWSQFQGDAAHSGAAGGPAPPYRLAWHASVEPGGPLGTQGLSAPVVAGDHAIVVGPEEIVAFEIGTGSEAWTVPRAPGPPASPALASIGGRTALLYTEGWAGDPPSRDAGATGSPSPSEAQDPTDPVDSHLVAIDLETREPVWEPVELPDQSRSGVSVEGDRAYVVDVTGEVVAIALDTGEVEWTASVDRPVTTAPAVSGDVVFVTGRGDPDAGEASIVALAAEDGDEIWRRTVDVPGIVVLSAAASSGGSVVLTSSDGAVRSYASSDGAERWTARPGATPTPFDSAVAIGDGVAFVTDTTRVGGSVYAIDLATGGVAWDFALNEPILRGAPIIVGGAVLVATTDGSLNAFDPATGERVWRSDRAGGLRSLASAGDLVLGVRGAPEPGLDAFGSDPGGSLVREASPTTPDYLRIVGLFLAAAIPVAAAALVAGRLLDERVAPAFHPDPDPDPASAEPAP